LRLGHLRVRDFPEMKIEEGIVEFEQIPTLVVVRPELSKTRQSNTSPS